MAVLAGLMMTADPEPGDAILFRIGARQWHLGIKSDTGLIHADAGLGRVVERPGPMPADRKHLRAVRVERINDLFVFCHGRDRLLVHYSRPFLVPDLQCPR